MLPSEVRQSPRPGTLNTVAVSGIRSPAASLPAFVLAELFLTFSYLLLPKLYLLAAIGAFVVLTLVRTPSVAFLLTLLQVVLTAPPLTLSAHPVLSVGGFDVSPADATCLIGVAWALLTVAHLPLSAYAAGRRFLGYLLSFQVILALEVLRTWQLQTGGVSLAIKLYRPCLYLIIAVPFARALRSGRLAFSDIAAAVNLASIGAALGLLGQAYGLITVSGFEAAVLSFKDTYFSKLGIIDEGLLPVLFIVALLSYLRGEGATRYTGLVATLFLGMSLMVSPGRGAIFATGCVVVLSGIGSKVSRRRPTKRPQRYTPVRVAILLIFLAVGVSYALKTLATANPESKGRIAGRVSESFLPWESSDFVRRSNGWRAGTEHGFRSPFIGQGFVNPAPDLEAKYGLDNPLHYPGTIPNIFAKAGFFGLGALFLIFGSIGRYAWRTWRMPCTLADYVLLPALLAIAVRSLSDDVLQSYQITVVLAVVLAVAFCAGEAAASPAISSSLAKASRVKR